MVPEPEPPAGATNTPLVPQRQRCLRETMWTSSNSGPERAQHHPSQGRNSTGGRFPGPTEKSDPYTSRLSPSDGAPKWPTNTQERHLFLLPFAPGQGARSCSWTKNSSSLQALPNAVKPKSAARLAPSGRCTVLPTAAAEICDPRFSSSRQTPGHRRDREPLDDAG